MIANQQTYGIPQFEVLTEDNCRAIYSASLEVLERTGVRMENEEVLALLRDNEVCIKNDIAHIPSYLVEESLRYAPKKILIYSREGKLAMRLENANFYFGTGSDCPNIIDSFTGKLRKQTRKDIGQEALIADALSNIDFVMFSGSILDEPAPLTDLYKFQEMVFNTTKPIIFTSQDKRDSQDIIDMASIIAGGEDKLRENPFIIHYIELSPPLKHSRTALDKLLLCSEKQIPIIYVPRIVGGATAPISLAGNIVLALAEGLAGLVISQLKNKGTPLILGGIITVKNMRTKVFSQGAPEFHLLSAGLAQVCQFLGMPMFGTAGCTDSKALDEQAAIEASLSIIIQSLSGANLIHDVGCMASGKVISFDMLVMSDEIIGMSKRVTRGLMTDEESLGVDVIDKVGPGGNYLTEEHTLRHFKTEYWRPQLLDRSDYHTWIGKGSKALDQRVNEKVKSILKEYQPELLDREKADQILQLRDKRKI